MIPLAFPRAQRRAVFFVVAVFVVVGARSAAAVVRTCGADPVANTADVLCAPPSGPCSDQLVVVGANVTVKHGPGCMFDLGGRALRVDRTLQTFGDDLLPNGISGGIDVENVGDVTISKHGRLKARGSLLQVASKPIGGGTIRITGSGAVTVAGTMDVRGDTGGVVRIEAAGDVTLARGSKMRLRGIASFRGLEGRFADGGDLDVRSFTGSIDVEGEITAPGSNTGAGGSMALIAARDIEIARAIDVSSIGEGGDLTVLAGGAIRVTASIDASSHAGGDDGGDIDIEAGLPLNPDLYQLDPDDERTLDVTTAIFDVRGSANENLFVGDGGTITLSAAGAVRVAADVSLRADGPPTLHDGSGGFITIDASDDASGIPRAGDLELDGLLSARGPYAGGEVWLSAGRDVVVSGAIEAGGGYAGKLLVEAGRSTTIGGPIDLAATTALGDAPEVRITSGEVQDGTLTVARDVRLSGGARGRCSSLELTACRIVVEPGVTIDAGCGDGSIFFLDAMHFTARFAMSFGAGTRLLADPGGRVTTIHPPEVTPAVGAGAVFTRERVDQLQDSGSSIYPFCAP